ncbi:response regulator [Botrimarina hoheduenensis]|uniref:Hydrogenase transcriptional regulatory protein hupR1 n=1 Tax=Botrimarina hoheduenensis TaxID=2528000 RepID=A0A5C5VYS0_9BACT|nr:response regulator [Botrimarina hoheduenensis]TWT42899.1 Hydrogenase transcriptional regulatory protein hupR1 [Botrimarina hoheduenensis]
MTTTPERVLLVDDDPNVLKAYERRLRRRFDVETALCSEEGVTAVNFLGPFAVIVSDMAMPRENGAEFLVRMHELSPESVRIMLTGNADQQTAVQAVNRARVFRFLSKPCQADDLEEAIDAGIQEYRRICAERDLMSQTVHGVVAMLSRVLSLTSPIAFGRANRLRAFARELGEAAEIDNAWELEIAAALSQLGAVALTEQTLAKVAQGQPLTAAESELLSKQYETAAELIAEAPRLDQIARVVALQATAALPATGDDPVMLRNASLLAIALEFDHLTANAGCGAMEAVDRLATDSKSYDPLAINALRKVVAKHDARRIIDVELNELIDGMHLVEDLKTTTGMVLVAKGHDVTASLRSRLKSYAETHELHLPMRVVVSSDLADEIESRRLALCP